jgi:hypothetical protein
MSELLDLMRERALVAGRDVYLLFSPHTCTWHASVGGIYHHMSKTSPVEAVEGAAKKYADYLQRKNARKKT